MFLKDSSQFQLQFDKKTYTLTEILSVNDISNYSTTQIEVIKFIHKWYNNESIIYQKTSGSTGTPKLINLSKNHMKASAAATVKSLGLVAGDTALLSISTDYIGGKMMVVRALEHQLVLIVGEVTANPLAKLSEDIQIDFFSFVPYQLQKILDESLEYASMLNKAKAIILGGAAVQPLLETLIKNQITSPCYSTYGMTETVSHIALKLLNRDGRVENFKATAGVTFSVTDQNCLNIHAPHITGHAKLSTNDVVELISETEFKWLGRIDFIINSGGIKIHAEELENQIAKLFMKHAIHNSFFVFGKQDKYLGEQLTLLVESAKPISELEDILVALPKIKRPKQIYYLDRFILTKNDKLDRKASIQAIN